MCEGKPGHRTTKRREVVSSGVRGERTRQLADRVRQCCQFWEGFKARVLFPLALEIVNKSMIVLCLC